MKPGMRPVGPRLLNVTGHQLPGIRGSKPGQMGQICPPSQSVCQTIGSTNQVCPTQIQSQQCQPGQNILSSQPNQLNSHQTPGGGILSSGLSSSVSGHSQLNVNNGPQFSMSMTSHNSVTVTNISPLNSFTSSSSAAQSIPNASLSICGPRSVMAPPPYTSTPDYQNTVTSTATSGNLGNNNSSTAQAAIMSSDSSLEMSQSANIITTNADTENNVIPTSVLGCQNSAASQNPPIKNEKIMMHIKNEPMDTFDSSSNNNNNNNSADAKDNIGMNDLAGLKKEIKQENEIKSEVKTEPDDSMDIDKPACVKSENISDSNASGTDTKSPISPKGGKNLAASTSSPPINQNRSSNSNTSVEVKSESCDIPMTSPINPPTTPQSSAVVPSGSSAVVAKKDRQPLFKVDELRQHLLPTLEKLYKQEPDSIPFRQPVDPQTLGIPDYFDIIKKPMDLSSIKRKLDTGQYTDPWDYVNDIWLMFDNAWLYNRKTSRVYRYCTKVRNNVFVLVLYFHFLLYFVSNLLKFFNNFLYIEISYMSDFF